MFATGWWGVGMAKEKGQWTLVVTLFLGDGHDISVIAINHRNIL